MKRIGNVYDKIISLDNLLLAHKNARKGKSRQKQVKEFEKDVYGNCQRLHEILKNEEYNTPKYRLHTIYEPKERIISVLPYFDRIVQHAILQIVGDMFTKTLTTSTYSCIKGRGIHKCKKAVEKAIRSNIYVLKMDITKFYPNVDHTILKQQLLRKIKDKKLIRLLFNIVNSSVGLPLGSYLSQILGNFYLNSLDHFMKEQLKAKYVTRYCDDICVFSNSKEELHRIRLAVELYLKDVLKLKLKRNYQIFPINKRGLDFLGYVFYKTDVVINIKLRKTIKKRFAKMVKYRRNKESIASYLGWLKHSNSINLKTKILTQ